MFIELPEVLELGYYAVYHCVIQRTQKKKNISYIASKH